MVGVQRPSNAIHIHGVGCWGMLYKHEETPRTSFRVGSWDFGSASRQPDNPTYSVPNWPYIGHSIDKQVVSPVTNSF